MSAVKEVPGAMLTPVVSTSMGATSVSVTQATFPGAECAWVSEGSVCECF